MKHITIYNKAGAFAENKDIARDIRISEVIPALEKNEEVILDFERVEAATQSFIHVLISELFRVYGSDVLDRITFKSCKETIQKVISIVVDYMQDGPESDER